MTITPITIADLTKSTLVGDGVFDVMMKTLDIHLGSQYDQGRIKGAEYATVYLGALDRTMQTALSFLVQKDQAFLQAQLIEQQVLLAQVEVLKANVALELLELQVDIAAVQKLQIEAQTELTIQQKANAIIEGTVLVAQECKLRAEFDLAMGQVLKSAQETALLTQKVVTEKAQTMAIGVDADSVIGKQKTLIGAQTDGFKNDAVQKGSGILVDVWKTQRMTDEGIAPNATNKLQDDTIGRAVEALLTSMDA